MALFISDMNPISSRIPDWTALTAIEWSEGLPRCQGSCMTSAARRGAAQISTCSYVLEYGAHYRAIERRAGMRDAMLGRINGPYAM